MEILTPEKVEQLEEASLEINNHFRQSWQKVLDINEPMELKDLAKILDDQFTASIIYLFDKVEEIYFNNSVEVISESDLLFEYTKEYMNYLKVKNPMILIGEAAMVIASSYLYSLKTDKEVRKGISKSATDFAGFIKDQERSFDMLSNSMRNDYDEIRDKGLAGVIEEYCRFYWYEDFPRNTEVWEMLSISDFMLCTMEFTRGLKAVRKELELRIRVEEG
jgi:hypothetical protein